MAQPAIRNEVQLAPHSRPLRPVDLVHLAKQCLGDENLEREVLRLFDTTLETYLSRLRLAQAADELLLTVHSIRGAAAGVGAWAVAEQARAMEFDVRDGRPLKPEQIEDLSMVIEEVRDFIRRMLASEEA